MGAWTRLTDASGIGVRGRRIDGSGRHADELIDIDKETPLFIAILDLRTTPADRPAALAQLHSERDEIRAMPGNLDFRVYADDDKEAVAVIHEWADQPSFAEYLASDAFARSGAVLRPLVTSPPVSRRFAAELLETV